jgi:Tir chaperone protein (CesT) family
MEEKEAREIANAALAGLTADVAEGLQLDEEGVCRLVFDDTSLYVVLDIASSDLVLWAPAGVLPPEGQVEILRKLMQANLFWGSTHGATLSLAPDGETVILACRVPLHGLKSNELGFAVEQMRNDATTFNEGLAFSGVLADPAAEAPAGDPSGMIRG